MDTSADTTKEASTRKKSVHLATLPYKIHGAATHKVQAPKSLDVDGRVETESVATNVGDSLLFARGQHECSRRGRWAGRSGMLGWETGTRRRTHRLLGAHCVGMYVAKVRKKEEGLRRVKCS